MYKLSIDIMLCIIRIFVILKPKKKEASLMKKIIKPIQPVKLHPPIKQKPKQEKPKENPPK